MFLVERNKVQLNDNVESWPEEWVETYLHKRGLMMEDGVHTKKSAHIKARRCVKYYAAVGWPTHRGELVDRTLRLIAREAGRPQWDPRERWPLDVSLDVSIPLGDHKAALAAYLAACRRDLRGGSNA